MIRVAYDHQIFSLQQYGGISRYFIELAARLSQNPHFDISVVAPLYINQYLRAYKGCTWVNGHYFPWQLTGLRHVISAGNALLLPVYWRGKTLDVVHETYYSDEPVGCGVVRIVTVHDMIHELFPDQYNYAPENAVSRRKLAAVRRADRVICISESTKQDLVRLLGIDQGKVHVVHHGVTPVDLAMCLPYRLENGKPYILYVGKRVPHYKNFLTVCRAYAQSIVLRAEVDLVVFGGGSLSAEELTEIERLGMVKQVHQVSGSDEQLSACYRGAWAFVYPSTYEGFGMPLLEAMSHECPVVCSRIAPLQEVAGNAALYFSPESPEDMAMQFEQLLGSTAKREQLIQNGNQRVSLFSWDNCVAKTKQIYEQAVADKI